MARLVEFNELKNYIGKDMGVSDWFEITQDRINTFADCTLDHQWIHVDLEKAKNGPYGTTIAHGFMALSLCSHLNYPDRVAVTGIKMALNYGLNKVRFMNPVPVGSRIRNHTKLKEVIDKGEGRTIMVTENSVEIEGQEKPAMVAETLGMLFT